MSSAFSSPSEKIFILRLKEARVAKGLTQKQLAEKVSVIHQAISNFESGRNLPTFTVLIGLADALEVSLDYLVGRSDTSFKPAPNTSHWKTCDAE